VEPGWLNTTKRTTTRGEGKKKKENSSHQFFAFWQEKNGTNHWGLKAKTTQENPGRDLGKKEEGEGLIQENKENPTKPETFPACDAEGRGSSFGFQG